MPTLKDKTENSREPRPLSIWGSLILFGIPTLLILFATRLGIPALRTILTGPDILCWFVAGGSVFFCLFVASFVAYWIEQGKISLSGLADRFRMRRITLGNVAWALGLLVTCGLMSAGIAGLWKLAANSWSAIPVPQLSPAFIHVEPIKNATSWILLAWLPLFFFNIAGEELWWRGYMLPREEEQHQSAAWFSHGIGLALFHLPLGVDLTIILLPFLFALPYSVQRTRNLWTGIILHGILNGGGFLAMAFGLA